METTLSPFRRMFSAASDSEGYHTCYPSDITGIEPNFPASWSHTVPNPKLARDTERELLKKVPTRTGPCCAPSACHPC